MNNRFDGICKQMVSMRDGDCERFVLPVNVDERLNSRGDFAHTVCGFLIQEDSMEVFDAQDALEVFAEWIREALISGKYTVNRKVIIED